MKITKKQLSNLIPQNNRVLCRLVQDNQKLVRSGILISPYIYKGQEMHHANRVFEVIKPCRKFVFYKNKMKKDLQSKTFSSPEWKTTIECVSGDLVISSAHGGLSAEKLICEDEIYYLVDYAELFLILREGGSKEINGVNYDVIPVNGYIICESVPEPNKSLILWTPGDNSIKWGKIYKAGKPNAEYWLDISTGKQDHDFVDKLLVGDLVKKRLKNIHFTLENKMYAFFDKDKEYFVIQRKDITMIKRH